MTMDIMMTMIRIFGLDLGSIMAFGLGKKEIIGIGGVDIIMVDIIEEGIMEVITGVVVTGEAVTNIS